MGMACDTLERFDGQRLADERTLFCANLVRDAALQRRAEMNAGLRDVSDR